MFCGEIRKLMFGYPLLEILQDVSFPMVCFVIVCVFNVVRYKIDTIYMYLP